MIAILVFLLSVVAAFYFIEYRRRRKPFEDRVNKFGGPPTLPIFGNVLSLLGSSTDVLKQMREWYETYESPFRVWIWSDANIVIAKPEDIQIFATKDLEKGKNYPFLQDLLGNGLVTCSPAEWKRRRRIADRAFNTTIWSNYFLEVFNQRNWQLVKSLNAEAGTGKHFNLWSYIITSSFSTICDTAMGYKEKEDENGRKYVKESTEKFLKASQLIFSRSVKPWLQPKLLFTVYTYLIGCSDIFESIQSLPRKLVKKKRQSLQNEKRLNKNEVLTNGKPMKNLLEILLEKQEGDNNYTDAELQDEMLTIIFAGMETNAVTDCFTTLMLAMRPDIQEKVYQEQVDIFSSTDRLPTVEDLYSMVLLEQCLKESLRLFTTIPLINRQANVDIPITNGYVIPAGCRIVFSPFAVHHCEKYYPNPYEWNPYNFDADRVAERHPYSFLPFGFGPRTCLGNKYAMLSMKAQLSLLVRNFKFSTDVKMEDIELSYNIVLKSAHGYKVKFEPRENRFIF